MVSNLIWYRETWRDFDEGGIKTFSGEEKLIFDEGINRLVVEHEEERGRY